MKKEYYENIINNTILNVSFEDDTYMYNSKSKCLYGKFMDSYIFIAHIRDNSIFIEFSDNNKKFLRHLFKYVYLYDNTYLLDIQISYPNILKSDNIYGKIDMVDVLRSIFYAYVNGRYYKLFSKANLDFLKITIHMCEKFDNGVDALFSEEIEKCLKMLLRPYEKSGYDWSMYRGHKVPLEYVPNEYNNLNPKMIKRLYNINSILKM